MNRKKFYVVKVKVVYECDGCPYDKKEYLEETFAESKAKAESNICWRMLGRRHIGGVVDLQPYNDKYTEHWTFEAEEFYTKFIDNRKGEEN